MNLAQTIDPETTPVARRSWFAILAQLQGEAVPSWCLPEPSELQTSGRRVASDADDDPEEDLADTAAQRTACDTLRPAATLA